MRFYGKEKQDRFAYYLIGKKGIFLDVGCYHPTQWNNTKALEEAGWKGLLFDIRDKWVDLCKQHRTSKVFCVDVSTDEFSSLSCSTRNSSNNDKTIIRCFLFIAVSIFLCSSLILLFILVFISLHLCFL